MPNTTTIAPQDKLVLYALIELTANRAIDSRWLDVGVVCSRARALVRLGFLADVNLTIAKTLTCLHQLAANGIVSTAQRYNNGVQQTMFKITEAPLVQALCDVVQYEHDILESFSSDAYVYTNAVYREVVHAHAHQQLTATQALPAQLGVIGKLILYSLDRLVVQARNAGNDVLWFSNTSIKFKATTLIRCEAVASVSSHPGAVGAVTSCLNRFQKLGVVTRSNSWGRRRPMYAINTNRTDVAQLLAALNEEVARNRRIDGRTLTYVTTIYSCILRDYIREPVGHTALASSASPLTENTTMYRSTLSSGRASLLSSDSLETAYRRRVNAALKNSL